MLAEFEPPAVTLVRPDSRSPFVFTVDHASARIPQALGDLGLAHAERTRHIAWDIGALAVATLLAGQFDATLVATGYSRLVIDCNRHPWREDSIPPVSELTEIPGNRGLSAADREARRQAFHAPYHAAISGLLDARLHAGRPLVYVAVHSFTPVYKGEARPWQVAMLSNRDRRLADFLLRELHRDPSLCIGDNIPYRVTDEGDYGIPVHAESRGIPHVLIELRQDEIVEPAGQRAWVARLAPLLARALIELDLAA
ncbi:MAG: N-formylglutamate amidohydrolase [Gammaproteobacteria bacterium]